MSFEVEIKYRDADHATLARRLLERGAEAQPEIEQTDTYLAHPSRDFRTTNEALRLRQHGDSNRVTYKGPKLEGPTKTREEVEVDFEAGSVPLAKMTRIFEALGFRPVAKVRKVRVVYHLRFQGRPLEIGLDLAEGLGAFAEVEAIAEGPDDLPAARQAVQDFARELGLRPAQVESRSYLRMILQARSEL